VTASIVLVMVILNASSGLVWSSMLEYGGPGVNEGSGKSTES
jgi:hypothetical protein